MTNLLKALLKEHPTLLLTFSYFVITIIGVLYSYHFYMAFDINIIKFADLSDFLLIAILEPRSIGLFVILVVLSVTINLLELKAKSKFTLYRRLYDKMGSKVSDAVATLIIVCVLTYIVLLKLAIANANQIKLGDFDAFEVRLSDPDKQVGAQTMALLGSSGRYGYFYNTTNQTALVVPIENISFMRKVGVTPAAKSVSKTAVQPASVKK